MRAFIKLIYLSLLLPSASELFAQQQPAPNILTLGDSNGTFPFSWPQQLKKELPHAQVFNISKSGRTIGFINNGDSSLNSLLVVDENLQKAAQFIKDRSFNFIVIELGTNDAKAVFAHRQNEIPTNLDKLIKKIKNSVYPSIAKAKIIIISPPPYGIKADTTAKYKDGGRRVEIMSETFKKVAIENGCLFVDGFRTPGLDVNTMTADGLHLDSVASRKLIIPVLDILKNNSFNKKK